MTWSLFNKEVTRLVSSDVFFLTLHLISKMGCFNFCVLVVQEEKGTYRTCDVHFFGVPRFDKQTLEAANLPHVTYTAKFVVYLE